MQDTMNLEPDKLRALELLRRGQRFLLVGHMRPDGDVIGAQAAMSRVLESLGKTVFIVNPDPPEGRYEYLSRDVRYRTFAGGDLPAHDVAVLLDFSELSRTGVMEEPLRKYASKKVVVDHHIHHGTNWWDECFVDVRAAATGLLVARIARELGATLDIVAARGVFTSLVTDTGWFKYSNTDAETLAVAGEMIALGVDPSALFGAIYQSRSHRHPEYVQKLLSRLEYFVDNKLAVIDQPLSNATDPSGKTSVEELDHKTPVEDLDLVDSDEVLDILRSVRAVEVVLFLREVAGGQVKLSARSKSDYDVNALARRFGGGGHKKASGATIPGALADVRAKVVAAAVEGFAIPASVGGPSAR